MERRGAAVNDLRYLLYEGGTGRGMLGHDLDTIWDAAGVLWQSKPREDGYSQNQEVRRRQREEWRGWSR